MEYNGKNNEKDVFVGIDFSKDTFDATATGGFGTHYGKYANDVQGYRQLLSDLRECAGRNGLRRRCLFCGEDTGVYSSAAADFLSRKEWDVWIDSPYRIRQSLGIIRGKSDRVDSGRIAEYARRFADRAEKYSEPAASVRTLEALQMQRKGFVDDRTAHQNRRRCIAAMNLPKGVKSRMLEQEDRIIRQLGRMIAETEAEMRSAVAEDAEVARNLAAVKSAPGIGMVTAVEIIILTRNFTRFGHDPRRFASFCGLAPFASQSGTSLSVRPHVSRMAHPALRPMLSMCALAAIRCDPKTGRYYLGLIARGKEKGVALNNVKNKIIHIAFALARKGEKYDSGFPGGKPCGKGQVKKGADKC